MNKFFYIESRISLDHGIHSGTVQLTAMRHKQGAVGWTNEEERAEMLALMEVAVGDLSKFTGAEAGDWRKALEETKGRATIWFTPPGLADCRARNALRAGLISPRFLPTALPVKGRSALVASLQDAGLPVWKYKGKLCCGMWAEMYLVAKGLTERFWKAA